MHRYRTLPFAEKVCKGYLAAKGCLYLKTGRQEYSTCYIRFDKLRDHGVQSAVTESTAEG